MKLYILDFDGTIADTIPHIVNCCFKIVRKYNLRELKQEDLFKFNGAILENVLIDLGATREMLPEIKKYYEDSFFEDISDIKMYPNVLETVKQLKMEGNKVVVATNRGRESLEKLLKAIGLYDYLDFIIAKEDVVNKKPAPDMVNLAKEKFNISSDNIVVVGDTKFDVQMGKNANCKTVGVCYQKELMKSFENCMPDIIINNFNELISKNSENDIIK